MTTPDTADVRRWALANGISVASRGRLPAEIHAAYLAAQADGAPSTTPRQAATATKEPTTVKAPRADKAVAPAVAARPTTSTGKPPVGSSSSKPAPAPAAMARTESVLRPQAAPRPETAAPPSRPQPTDRAERAPHTDPAETNSHITALQQQVTALAERVSSLEKAAASAGSSSSAGTDSKPSLFRRRKG